jgi:hypothetical protein
MAPDAEETFARWQGITRDHFSSVSSLILGLATGLIAFVASDLRSEPQLRSCGLVLGILVLASLTLSVLLALWCAVNRLHDFRATSRIARKRSLGEQIPPGDRHETRVLGERSWTLFWWQLALFGFGAAAVVASTVARVW